MINRNVSLLAAAVLAMSCVNANAESPFSGTLDVVSDYDFRGASQTDRGPALQLGLEYGHASGFYAGIWGSNVDFDTDDGANIEVDFYVGFGFDLAEGVALDLVLNRYTYPGTNTGIDYDYNELIGKITFADAYYFELGYSNDVFASGERGVYYGGGAEWAMPADFTLDARLGYYDLDRAVGDSYVEWALGATRTFGPVDLSLRYHDTNGKGEDIFGSAAKARLILGLHVAF